MRELKPQLNQLERLTKQLEAVITDLQEAKTSYSTPSFLDYLAPNSMFGLEQQNNRLRTQVSEYESMLKTVSRGLGSAIRVLKNLEGEYVE